jgi:acetyltransferase-like isoleucine patch superfamily enzyme
VVAAEVVLDDVNVSYPSDLLELNLAMLAGQPNWFGTSVQVAPGAQLGRCVVMDGAEIGPGVTLSECLLFPGARVAPGTVRRRTIFTAGSEIRCDEPDSGE